MTTGQRIKAARQSAGLTQKELGAKMGIAYQTLAQWENDLRKPKMDTLQRLACALNVPAAELMGNDGRIITERMLDEELDRAFFYKLDEHLAGLTMREKDPLYLPYACPGRGMGQNIVSRQEKPLQRPRKRPQRGNKVIVCHRSDDMKQRTGEPII